LRRRVGVQRAFDALPLRRAREARRPPPRPRVRRAGRSPRRRDRQALARALGARSGGNGGGLARGGADLVKDDELLGDPDWCPLEERVRRVVDAIPAEVRYAPNVTGPPESLLARAERAVELGARALMLNAFA